MAKRNSILKEHIPVTLTDEPFYGLELDEEQKHFRDCIWSEDYDIIFANSRSGSGKTTVAVGTANLLVQYKKFEKIIYICSPCNEGRLGFLPGSITDKSEVYYEPLYTAMQTCGINPFTAIVSESLTASKYDEAYIKPLTDVYLRGTNLNNAVIIIDEFQNFTLENAKKTLTRVCENTKVIAIGHSKQCDLGNDEKKSGFERYLNHFAGMPRCAICELHTNHRSWISNHADDLDI